MGQLVLGGWLSGTRLDGLHNLIRDVWAIEGNKVVPGWGECGGRICAGRMSYILQVVINIPNMLSGQGSACKGYGPPPHAGRYPDNRNDVLHRAKLSRGSKGLSYVHSGYAGG